jgi:hypothetical protein
VFFGSDSRVECGGHEVHAEFTPSSYLPFLAVPFHVKQVQLSIPGLFHVKQIEPLPSTASEPPQFGLVVGVRGEGPRQE